MARRGRASGGDRPDEDEEMVEPPADDKEPNDRYKRCRMALYRLQQSKKAMEEAEKEYVECVQWL